MKLISACLVVAAVAIANSAAAQTCANPVPYQGNLTPALSGTTCGGDTTAAGYCGGNLDAPGPAFVMRSTLNFHRTATSITVNGGAGYDAIILMSQVSDGCGTNAPCVATGDASSPINLSTVPDGDYYLIVTAATFDVPGSCGTFTVATNGDLPVELIGFTVT